MRPPDPCARCGLESVILCEECSRAFCRGCFPQHQHQSEPPDLEEPAPWDRGGEKGGCIR